MLCWKIAPQKLKSFFLTALYWARHSQSTFKWELQLKFETFDRILAELSRAPYEKIWISINFVSDNIVRPSVRPYLRLTFM